MPLVNRSLWLAPAPSAWVWPKPGKAWHLAVDAVRMSQWPTPQQRKPDRLQHANTESVAAHAMQIARNKDRRIKG